MYREEEIAKGSDDEKRVSNAGTITVQAESIENRIEQTADTEEGKMLL
ncbi:MAG: hypothetical protein J6K48_05495 [Lachnospiraceae bacterium]|nr:hypothetical protein [Lachnospiraceae bacterium]MBP3475753.1 hypothetical protein [Lachnospiraceae bacterium]